MKETDTSITNDNLFVVGYRTVIAVYGRRCWMVDISAGMVVLGREIRWSMSVAGMVVVGRETTRWSMWVAGMVVVVIGVLSLLVC